MLAFIWPPLSIFAAAIILGIGIGLFMASPPLDGPLGLAYYSAFYLLAAVLAIAPWRKVLFAGETSLRYILGIVGRPRLKAIGLAVVYFLLYVIALLIMSFVIRLLLPQQELYKPQDLFVAQPVSISQYVVAFALLAVLPPIAEELIFRGFVFGALSRQTSFWPAAVLSSLAFAALHLQLNVAIDIFILSLFLAHLRQKTGSVWAPIVLHSLKNSLAFLLLFVFVVR